MRRKLSILAGGSGSPPPAVDWNFAGMYAGSGSLGSSPLPSDITFTRASDGTYWDAAGVLQTQAANNYTYSQLFSNVIWVKDGAATVGSEALSAPDGSSTATRIIAPSSSGSHGLKRVTITHNAAVNYVASIYIKQDTLGATPFQWVEITTTGGTDGTQRSWFDIQNKATGTVNHDNANVVDVGDGWQRISVSYLANAANGIDVYCTMRSADGSAANVTGDDVSGYIVWGAQFELGASTPTAYIPTTTVAASLPRFTHGPSDNTALGLLIEGARTNLCLQNRSLTTTWGWIGGTGTAVKDQTGIDGVSNSAWTIGDDNASGSERLEQSFTVADDSLDHTASIYIKKDSDETRFFGFGMDYSGGTGVARVVELNTKTGAHTPPSVMVESVEDHGDWWRLIATMANNGTGNTTLKIKLYPSYSTVFGTPSNAAQGTVIADYVQLEKASFPTSPIATTTASVARAADVAADTVIDWFNPSEGTFVATVHIPIANGSNRRLFDLDDGTNNERIVFNHNSSKKTALTVIDGGVVQASPAAATAWASGDTRNVGYAYALNDFVIYEDGVQEGSDAAGTLPTVDALRIGTDKDGGTHLNGTISRIRYYPRRLKDFDLARLTT